MLHFIETGFPCSMSFEAHDGHSGIKDIGVFFEGGVGLLFGGDLCFIVLLNIFLKLNKKN